MFAGARPSQLTEVQYYVELAVNRQLGFRQKLVEQKLLFSIRSQYFSMRTQLEISKYKLFF